MVTYLASGYLPSHMHTCTHAHTQHGADVNRRNRDNLLPLDMVKESDSDIADLLRGDSALLDAAKKGDLDRVRKLTTPENINCKDEHGRNSTPLHLAGRGVCGWLVVHHTLPLLSFLPPTCLALCLCPVLLSLASLNSNPRLPPPPPNFLFSLFPSSLLPLLPLCHTL